MVPIFLDSETFLFLGMTLGTIGKVLLGITVILVHSKMLSEHRIDRVVLKEMRREQVAASFGIIFIVLGFLCEIVFFDFVPYSACGFVSTEECARLQQLES